MRAKAYLMQLKKLDRMIENKTFELEHWRDMALSVTAKSDGERVQTSGNPQKMADAVDRYIDLENEISERIGLMIETRRKVIATIERLNPTEYDMLHKIYVQRMTLDDVAAIYGKTYSWATTVHGRALKHLQEVLDNDRDV